jgi:hypothetical protein
MSEALLVIINTNFGKTFALYIPAIKIKTIEIPDSVF